MIRLLPLLFLVGCTSLDVNAGKYFTNADNTDVTITASGGKITSYHAGINNHSGPIRSYGSVGGTLLMGAAMLGATHGAAAAIPR